MFATIPKSQMAGLAYISLLGTVAIQKATPSRSLNQPLLTFLARQLTVMQREVSSMVVATNSAGPSGPTSGLNNGTQLFPGGSSGDGPQSIGGSSGQLMMMMMAAAANGGLGLDGSPLPSTGGMTGASGGGPVPGMAGITGQSSGSGTLSGTPTMVNMAGSTVSSSPSSAGLPGSVGSGARPSSGSAVRTPISGMRVKTSGMSPGTGSPGSTGASPNVGVSPGMGAGGVGTSGASEGVLANFFNSLLSKKTPNLSPSGSSGVVGGLCPTGSQANNSGVSPSLGAGVVIGGHTPAGGLHCYPKLF
ncbi:unnamed protein product [Protopolystoma xenopodis]|uniref:Uncharacterized protein n=1 Tax=Protopolystoma xenopodis TaxID=117903 RepID=A0A3S5CMC2_9PLAT|nr:unnamed protein product [Protopolystoma xenopodis]